MRIAIDVSPLEGGKHSLQHRIRGAGFYIENLKKALLRYCPQHDYVFFSKRQELPENIDIIHYPYFEPYFLTLPFLERKKIIVTIHDLTPIVYQKNFPPGLKGSIKWQMQRLFLKKRVNAVISDSCSSKNDIVRYVDIAETKINIVYLAAGDEFKENDNSEMIKRIKKKYNLPDKFILYVGDVTWNKNLPRLIKAIKLTNLNLVMVGKTLKEKEFDKKNPWNQDLVEVKRLIEGDNKIICLGFIPSEDLVTIYNIATVFVMPSIYEGFGLPILEAMKCGCPVVTTKRGSIPEIAGNAAFYVDAYNIKNISESIQEVFLNSKLKEKLIQEGLKQSMKFSWQKTAEETIKIYQGI